MVRAGQSSQKAQLIYQHTTLEHQHRIAEDIDAEVRGRRSKTAQGTEPEPPAAPEVENRREA
ncbi:hypothetical protein GCM10012280_17420 [Wenjunlia tyrosinilytica]|uniref:Integrase n=2 Tax=Wenjunlia tyrosinilytica TaxID=1544741 RepID=A0A918DW32_9ACTN|nr:hypothetical protein GCM10012280_17420 [Wenjunlia tyrosinilytica]